MIINERVNNLIGEGRRRRHIVVSMYYVTKALKNEKKIMVILNGAGY
jgi:hypothetical protein